MPSPKTLAALVAPLALAAGCAGAPGRDEMVSAAGDMAQAAGRVADSAYDAARRAAAPPQLAPLAVAGPGPALTPQPVVAALGPGGANSLWRPGSRNFFNDQRATRVGDLLRVEISIDDRAEVSNSSNRQRSASTEVGVDNVLGLQAGLGRLLPGGFDPSNLISADASSSQNGTGAISRNETIQLTVAAVVTEVLPNGNLVIAGRQQVRVNAELRELTVAGVIRPEDVSADNAIRHDQIAEARISYGGRGQITAVQRPKLGQRIADALSPW